MGQGHYTGIVFGAIVTRDVYHRLRDADELNGLGLEFRYEARNHWVGVPVVQGGYAVWDAPEDMEYTAIPVDAITAWVERVCGKSLEMAQAKWQAARAESSQVPEGTLILVSDYD